VSVLLPIPLANSVKPELDITVGFGDAVNKYRPDGIPDAKPVIELVYIPIVLYTNAESSTFVYIFILALLSTLPVMLSLKPSLTGVP
jgi:hypothetical protein